MSEIAKKSWRYAINYGPDGEENYANVYDADGQLVGNLKTHHAIAVVAACNNNARQEKMIEHLRDSRDHLHVECSGLAGLSAAVCTALDLLQEAHDGITGPSRPKIREAARLLHPYRGD